MTFHERQLRNLRPGRATTLQFPGALIVGRVAYQPVNGLAWRLLGSGRYRLEKPRGSKVIRVTHLMPRAPSPCAATTAAPTSPPPQDPTMLTNLEIKDNTTEGVKV